MQSLWNQFWPSYTVQQVQTALRLWSQVGLGVKYHIKFTSKFSHHNSDVFWFCQVIWSQLHSLMLWRYHTYTSHDCIYSCFSHVCVQELHLLYYFVCKLENIKRKYDTNRLNLVYNYYMLVELSAGPHYIKILINLLRIFLRILLKESDDQKNKTIKAKSPCFFWKIGYPVRK